MSRRDVVGSSSIACALACAGCTLYSIPTPEPPGHLASCPSAEIEIHGHRGAFGDLPPGNTARSFLLASRQGATAWEADVRLTKDGALVLHHDAQLSAACVWPPHREKPATRRIREISSGELALSDCHPAIAGVQPPAPLSWLLGEASQRKLGLNLELKPAGSTIAQKLAGALFEAHRRCAGCFEDRLTVQSFRWEQLQQMDDLVRDLRAEDTTFDVRLSLLSADPELKQLEQASAFVDVLSPDHRVFPLNKAQLRQVQSQGLLVIPWTVNDPQRIHQLLRWGVDGIISDHPGRVRGLRDQMAEELAHVIR